MNSALYPRGWSILHCIPEVDHFYIVSQRLINSTLYPRGWSIPHCIPEVDQFHIVPQRLINSTLYPRGWSIPHCIPEVDQFHIVSQRLINSTLLNAKKCVRLSFLKPGTFSGTYLTKKCYSQWNDSTARLNILDLQSTIYGRILLLYESIAYLTTIT